MSGVYYQCPLVSDEVLDKETWYEKIEEFFSHQLSEDEAGLSACLIIHSCNEGQDRINCCVKTLCKYLDNIINDPAEKKYWKIRTSNKIFQVFIFCVFVNEYLQFVSLSYKMNFFHYNLLVKYSAQKK